MAYFLKHVAIPHSTVESSPVVRVAALSQASAGSPSPHITTLMLEQTETVMLSLPTEPGGEPVDFAFTVLKPTPEQALILKEFQQTQTSPTQASPSSGIQILDTLASDLVSPSMASELILLKFNSWGPEKKGSWQQLGEAATAKMKAGSTPLDPQEANHLQDYVLGMAAQELQKEPTSTSPTVRKAHFGVREKVRTCHFGLLVSLSYPDLDIERKKLALQLMLPFFIDDDYTDTPGSSVYTDAKARTALNNVLRGILKTGLSEDVLSSSPELWTRALYQLFDSAYRSVISRFEKDPLTALLAEIKNYFVYVAKVVALRTPTPPEPEVSQVLDSAPPTPLVEAEFIAAIKSRGYTGAVSIQVYLALALKKLNVDQTLASDANFKNALEAVSMASNLSNDMIGYTRGDHPNENIVAVISRLPSTISEAVKLGRPISEVAMYRALDMHNNYITTLIYSLALLKADADYAGNPIIDEVSSILYNVSNSVFLWEKLSGRYV